MKSVSCQSLWDNWQASGRDEAGRGGDPTDTINNWHERMHLELILFIVTIVLN